MSIGIYKITSPSGRIYIGQSVNIETRWRDYKHTKHQPRIQRSFKKYGVENHVFEIVEECLLEELTIREHHWQNHYNVLGENGLNCFVVDLKTKKRVYSEESRMKMSENRRGEKNHRYGVKLNDKECERISKVHKGKKVTEETKIKRKNTVGNKQSGGGNPKAKKVICTVTGVVFGCIKDCSEHLNMNRKTLNDQLNGKYTNRTTFILLNIITDGGLA